jgi:NRPS condensation-like uncharacterized protein
MRVDLMATTTPLNVLDELYLHLDREDEPWTVHVEIRVDGAIELVALEAAVREAATRHPIARAQLAPFRATDLHYEWVIAEQLAEVDLREVTCRDPDDLDRARERLLNTAPSLDHPGPFSLLLAHTGDGDVVVLNLHHAAGDGLSALRLLGSIARAYAGDDDPLPSIDPLEVRDVSALTAPGSAKERLERGRAGLDYLARGVTTPTRIAPLRASDQPGYGFAFVALEPAEVEHVIALRQEGATVNDVLLGGLATTVNGWNERLGASSGTVYLMMPINLRPGAWRQEIVGNFASYVSVRIDSGHQTTLDAAIQAAAASTRRIKDGGIAGLIIDLFGAPTFLPTGIKRRLQDLLPLTGNVLVDTAVLSNLGRIDNVPHLGDAGSVRELWFSPPGRMPLGASFGVATLGGRLLVTLRYRRALLDATAADQFLGEFKEKLLAGQDSASP